MRTRRTVPRPTFDKTRTWALFAAAKPGDTQSSRLDLRQMTLIVLSVIAIALSSVQEIEARFGLYRYLFEVFSVAIFTVEYRARMRFRPETCRSPARSQDASGSSFGQ